MQSIYELKPKLVWYYLNEILAIPRPSKKERDILNYLKTVAMELNLSCQEDETGNLLITKPASPGKESVATVILQSHVDMVCEKNSSSYHNFDTDPIQAYIDDGWLKARDTTLGADNGIGVAAQLALLAGQNLLHGKIECLFTVDEETGMTGAMGLSPTLLSGKILLNLDSEDDGELFIGCAGGIDTLITYPMKFVETNSKYREFTLSVSGLLGGHSGDDINKGRGNANIILAGALKTLMDETDMQVCKVEGGNLRNAIPREAGAIIMLPGDIARKAEKLLKTFKEETGHKLPDEPGLRIELNDSTHNFDHAFEDRKLQELIDLILRCPNGVVEMSRDVEGLVQTSTNLASVHSMPESNAVEIVTSQRSSLSDSKTKLASTIRDLFKGAGAHVRHTDAYPGWSPNPDSEILKIAERSYQKLFNELPKVKAIHAGLECGLFLEKYPDLDMISFGPTIRGAHSPDERLEIKTVEKFWIWLLDILESIPEE